MQLSYYTNDAAKITTEALAEMFKAIGINVEISNEDWAIYYENVRAGNFDVAAMGITANYLHPNVFMSALRTGNTSNHTKYSNPDFDVLYDAAMAEQDEEKAFELMREAEDVASATYPHLYLFHRSNMMLIRPGITGVYRSQINNLYFKSAVVTD